jgi:transcriptional regulator with XRE-family HTH domain
MSPQQVFGARVRALRLAAQMTQEDLAEHCGLFRTYMSRIETGQANPTLTMIHALAVALGVPAATLLSTDTELAPAPSPKGRNRKLGNPPSRGRVG